MQALAGLAWLLALQSTGELLARGLGLPFPGPVVGMLLLLFALNWRVVREPVGRCAEFLLLHLSLLFVPVGVGVMTHLSLVSQYGFRMLAVVVLSTLAGLGVTVLCMNWMRGKPGSEPRQGSDA
jgi:holin-like protein